MTFSNQKLAVASTLFLLVACNADAQSGTGGSASSSTTANTSTATGETTGAGGSTPACVEDDLKILSPFAGPGWDPAKGHLVGAAQDSYVASTTLLFLRPESAAQMKFFQLATAAMGKANKSAGLVGLMVATSEKCGTARTITVWKSADDMMTFVTSPEHGAAMAAATEVSLTGTVTSWTATASDLPPTFDTAMKKLDGVSPAY